MTIRQRGLLNSLSKLGNRLQATPAVSVESADETQPTNDTQPNVDPEVGDPQPEQPEVVEIAAPEGNESPEAQEINVIEAQLAVVSVEEQIDEALDVIQQVEQVSEIVEQSVDNGGLDPVGAQLLAVNLESLYSRLDMPRAKYVPSVEEFGGISNRLRSTTVSVEDMKERIQAIWKRVLEVLQVLAAKAQEFLTQLFNSAERYKARIAKLKEVNAKAPDQAQETEFEDARVVNALALGADIPTDLVGAVKKWSNDQGLILKKSIDAYDGEGGRKFFEALNLAKSATQDIVIKKATEAAQAIGKDFSAIPAMTPEDDLVVTATYIGNVRIEANITTDISKLNIRLAKRDVQVNTTTVKVKSKNETLEILEAAEALVNLVLENKAAAAKGKELSNKFQSAVKSLEVGAGRVNEAGANSATFTELAKGITASVRFLNTVTTAIDRHSLQTVAALSTYAEKSIKAHSPKKEEAPAEQTAAA